MEDLRHAATRDIDLGIWIFFAAYWSKTGVLDFGIDKSRDFVVRNGDAWGGSREFFGPHMQQDWDGLLIMSAPVLARLALGNADGIAKSMRNLRVRVKRPRRLEVIALPSSG